jgi:translation initiation factor IF-2
MQWKECAPEMKEEILGTAEIREIFKISKVGSIAGCMVMDGKISRNAKIRIIRDCCGSCR